MTSHARLIDRLIAEAEAEWKCVAWKFILSYHDTSHKHSMILIMMPLAVALGDRFGLLALQSGALRISAYRDFHPIPNPTLPLIAFKHLSLSMVIWNSASRPRQINVDQARPKQVSILQVSKYPSVQVSQVSKYPSIPSMQMCKYSSIPSMQVSQVCKYAGVC